MQESLRTPVTVKRLSAVGGLAQWQRLQELAEDVFGTGDRPAQWFRRKLRREVVDERLSWLAVTDSGRWCGYLLLGMPPSLPGVARTAGVGVIASHRGRGIGRRLMAAATAAADKQGAAWLRTVATESARPFYHRQGFVPRRCLTTLRHHGRARHSRPLPNPLPWDPPPVRDPTSQQELCGWLEEAWDGTEAELRRTLIVPTPSGPNVVHLAREGVAWLIHRWVCPAGSPPAEAVLDQVRDHFDPRTPILVTAVEPPLRERLMAAGWTIAQVGYEMELPTLRALRHQTQVRSPSSP